MGQHEKNGVKQKNENYDVRGRCDAHGAWYKMNGETTENLKNSHLQHLLTSTNNQAAETVRCNNQTNK